MPNRRLMLGSNRRLMSDLNRRLMSGSNRNHLCKSFLVLLFEWIIGHLQRIPRELRMFYANENRQQFFI